MRGALVVRLSGKFLNPAAAAPAYMPVDEADCVCHACLLHEQALEQIDARVELLVDRRHDVVDRRALLHDLADAGDHAEPGCARCVAERAELLFAAALVRDAGRVDDVVAVRRALPGLERRREVEVRRAELAHVRQRKLAGGTEAEPLVQLETVGATEVGHARRRSTRARPCTATFGAAGDRSFGHAVARSRARRPSGRRTAGSAA